MALDAGIGANSASSSYDVDNSLKLEADNTERLNLSYPSTGTRTSQTISCWVKRVKPGSAECVWETATSDGHEQRLFLRFQTDNTLRISTATTVIRNTNRVFEDTAAWYHIVVAWDTGQSTASDRFKMYINGVEETSFGTSADFNQNQNTGAGIGELSIGYSHIDTSAYCRMYIAEFVSLNGQYLTASSFGNTNSDGEWVPKDVSGLTYGDQDAYLDFSSASALGDDKSGQGHDFSLTNITSVDQATDTPTNNFCTMNNNSRNNGNIHSEHGATYIKTDGGSGWCSMNATMGAANGKWYWEIHFYNDPGDTNTVMVGLAGWNDPWIPHRNGGYYTGNVATGGSIGWYFVNGSLYNDNSYGAITGPGYGDTACIALDMDSSDPKAYFGINGTWATPSGGTQMDPANGTNGVNLASCFSAIAGAADVILPSVSVYQGNEIKYMNFGGYTGTTISSSQSDANGYGNFEYAVPSGFYALCSKNLGEFG